MAEEIHLRDSNGNLYLYSRQFNLKIDSNRRVYIQANGKDARFKFINKKVPPGMTREDKQEFLLRLKRAIELELDEYEEEDNKHSEVKNTHELDE